MKRKKYLMGTSVKNYMENPATELQQELINQDKALLEAKSDPWINGLQTAGNIAMQAGLAGAGAQFGLDPQMSQKLASTATTANQALAFAMGGQVPNIPVEVEGGESFETPDGNAGMFKGPDHSQGGIPISLPEGTEIYSKRIKIDGVSMADRKKKREKKTVTLEQLLEKNPTDALLRNSNKLTKKNNEIEDAKDMKIQEFVSQALDANKQSQMMWGGKLTKYDDGGVISSYENNGTIPSYQQWKKIWNNSEAGANTKATRDMYKSFFPDAPSLADNANQYKNYVPTLGDSIGLVGQGISTFSSLKTLKESRAQDTPNINAFRNYGQEGLDTIRDLRGLNQGLKQEQLSDLQYSKTASQNRLRGTARGVNQLRALDIANENQFNNQEQNVNAQAYQQLMGIIGQEANMQNQQDSVVMRGEQARDLANRQDNDNYFTQLAKARENMGFGLQNIGSSINQIKGRGDNQNNIDDIISLNEEAALRASDLEQFDFLTQFRG